jgi:hypothetical protein
VVGLVRVTAAAASASPFDRYPVPAVDTGPEAEQAATRPQPDGQKDPRTDERGFAILKAWRTLTTVSSRSQRVGTLAKAVLVLKRHQEL